MTEQKLSKNLRELRLSLRLSQIEMSKKLGIGEKMYQLYESGKYDNVKTETVKRKKFLDKIEELKKNTEPPAPSNPSDLEKENLRLHSIIEEKNIVIADKNKHISALEKIVMYQESMIGKQNKKVAHMIHHKSRQG